MKKQRIFELQSPNTVWHRTIVTRERREQLNGHKSAVIWFTGLSGSGKSTLAHTVEEKLHRVGCRTFVFDGDNVRRGLCGDLGFSKADRQENLRRIGHMVKLFVDGGILALTAFISPFRSDRENIRKIVGDTNFIEIYCRCAIEVCEQRDVKGLYRRARAGEIKEFTGVSSPYEEPRNPDLIIDTDTISLEESADVIFNLLVGRSIVQVNVQKGSAKG